MTYIVIVFDHPNGNLLYGVRPIPEGKGVEDVIKELIRTKFPHLQGADARTTEAKCSYWIIDPIVGEVLCEHDVDTFSLSPNVGGLINDDYDIPEDGAREEIAANYGALRIMEQFKYHFYQGGNDNVAMRTCPNCDNTDAFYIYRWSLLKHRTERETDLEADDSHITTNTQTIRLGKIASVRCGKCDYESSDPSEFHITE